MSPMTPIASQSPAPTPKELGTGADFDFLVGHWHVRHRRLRERLAGCTAWDEFDGTTTGHRLMAGRLSVDDNLLDLPTGPYRAASVRSFDPATGLWAIWWIDGRQPHTLDPPVVGRFEDGVGTFLADDQLRGQPIQVRFRWSRRADGRWHWEQAFRPLPEGDWETNWTMDFDRVHADAT